MDNDGQQPQVQVVTAFRKVTAASPSVLKKVRRKAQQRRNRERNRPVDAAFIAALCTNGGNPKAAARDVGIDPETGVRWLKQRKQIREAYEQFQKSTLNRMQDWGELLPMAQKRLVHLMDSKQDIVSLAAAREVLARGLGPVVQKIDAVVRHEEELTDVQLQAAVSLMASRGLTWSEAAGYVRDNPEEVRAWALQVAQSRQGLVLAAGGEVVEGTMQVVSPEPAVSGLGRTRG